MAKFQSNNDVYIRQGDEITKLGKILSTTILRDTLPDFDIDIDDNPFRNQSSFEGVINGILKINTSETEQRREEMMNMLTDPKTGKELCVDLAMAEKYNFDNNRAYSLEHGEQLRILVRFESKVEKNTVDLVARLMHQTNQINEKRFEITEQRMQEVLYDLIYNRKEYDILMSPYMKDVYDNLMDSLVEGHYAFLEELKDFKGIGISYDKKNTIVNFFNEANITMKSAHVNKSAGIINVNDSDQKNLDCVFYTKAFPEHVLFFTESSKARFVNMDKLPAEIKAALPIIQEEESLKNAINLSENRQYFFDTIINPIREVSRKESIASQFSDIDIDF